MNKSSGHEEIITLSAILYCIMKQIDLHMYDIGLCPFTNFEWNQLRHVWVMALDMKKSLQNGRLVAILDCIENKINVHMYSCPCTNFEWNRFARLPTLKEISNFAIPSLYRYLNVTPMENETKMPLTRPNKIISRNKSTCICKTQVNVLVPTLNEIGCDMSELLLRTWKKS